MLVPLPFIPTPALMHHLGDCILHHSFSLVCHDFIVLTFVALSSISFKPFNFLVSSYILWLHFSFNATTEFMCAQRIDWRERNYTFTHTQSHSLYLTSFHFLCFQSHHRFLILFQSIERMRQLWNKKSIG